jgi:hypothetical protein
MTGWQYVVSIREEDGWRELPPTEDHEEANRLYEKLAADQSARVKVRVIPPARKKR